MSFWHKDHPVCWLVKKSTGIPPATSAPGRTLTRNDIINERLRMINRERTKELVASA
jgi:hypothetical protein